MNGFKYTWLIGLLVTGLLLFAPVILFVSGEAPPNENPWAVIKPTPAHTDHAPLMPGPYESGSEVTLACLECHEAAAAQVMDTVHWTWESKPVLLPGRDEPVTIGKKNQINNFCIGIEGNWPSCTSCHAGYGWADDSFDFTAQENVDCLVCHADTALYAKGKMGLPAEGTDLAAAAQSVHLPTRQNCGSCHFNGGGGNAVKHGDLDQTLYFPTETIDVHMGRYNFQCIDCHGGRDHQISGHLISVSPDSHNNLACTTCHNPTLHQDARINTHVASVACQTCHIPEGAVRTATKMDWDWSTAGQDIPEDPHTYLKIKGSFVYESGFQPTYAWYNGQSDRYILGDLIDPTQVTSVARPLGEISDPTAQIWPFKVHTAMQPYDAGYNYLFVPRTAGEGGYWTTFDWDSAFRLNAPVIGLAYSGQYGFAPTEMYWALTHMVRPKEYALQCHDCHGENGRMDWEALGYLGDPIRWGGRRLSR